MHITIECDGASDQKYGGYGFVIKEGQKIVKEGFGGLLGTSNTAEWKAVMEGVRAAKEMGFSQFTIQTDSKLVVNQLNRKWRIRKAHLKKCYKETMEVLASCEWLIRWIPRELNERADELSKKGFRRCHGRPLYEWWKERSAESNHIRSIFVK